LQRADLIVSVLDKVASPDLFYVPAHRYLFSALIDMSKLDSRVDMDVLMVIDYLQNRGILQEVGGDAELMELHGVGLPHRFQGYLDSVLEAYTKRCLIRAATEVVGQLYDDWTVEDAVGSLESAMSDMFHRQSGVKITAARSVIPAAIREIADPTAENGGYSWGIPAIDSFLVGLKKKHLYILAARPSVGKSALAHNIVLHFGKNVGPAGLISLEMDAVSITKRMLAAEALIDPVYFRADRFNSLRDAAQRVEQAEIYIEESPSGTANQLRSRGRALYLDHKIKLLVIDYLQLFQGTNQGRNNTRERDVAELSSTCKCLARELDIPVVALCQLKRSMENRRPRLSDLRESGSIEQDADGVILLHRKDSPFDKDIMARVSNGGAIEQEAIFAKNRNGRVGSARLFYYPRYTLFRDTEIDYRQNQ
jgi:replicative DNA helicase